MRLPAFRWMSHALTHAPLVVVAFVLVGCASNLERRLKESFDGVGRCQSADECAHGPARVAQHALDVIILRNFPEQADVYSVVMWTDEGETFALTEFSPEIHLSISMYNALSWNQLVALMAHELAHQIEHHPQIATAVNSSIKLADAASWFVSPWLIFSPVDELMMLAVSRHLEMEADVMAIQYLENAGYTKADYLSLLERVAEMEHGTGCRLWCTHPHVEDRIQAVKEGRNILDVDLDKKDWSNG